MNPIGLKGQIHGGIAQGLGQALMEQVVYDRKSGQNLTGSFMDYCMPRADTMPYMEITSNPVPTKRNPLGGKGAGEAGTVGALPAIVNAVVDALSRSGQEPRHAGDQRAHLAGNARCTCENFALKRRPLKTRSDKRKRTSDKYCKNGCGEACEHDSTSGQLLKPTSRWLLIASGEIFLCHLLMLLLIRRRDRSTNLFYQPNYQ